MSKALIKRTKITKPDSPIKIEINGKELDLNGDEFMLLRNALNDFCKNGTEYWKTNFGQALYENSISVAFHLNTNHLWGQ